MHQAGTRAKEHTQLHPFEQSSSVVCSGSIFPKPTVNIIFKEYLRLGDTWSTRLSCSEASLPGHLAGSVDVKILEYSGFLMHLIH